jgi:hypothetical protein
VVLHVSLDNSQRDPVQYWVSGAWCWDTILFRFFPSKTAIVPVNLTFRPQVRLSSFFLIWWLVLQETHLRRFYHCEMQLYTLNVHYLTRKQQDSMLTSSGKSPSALLWIKKHALGWYSQGPSRICIASFVWSSRSVRIDKSFTHSQHSVFLVVSFIDRLGILFICNLLWQTEDDQKMCTHTIYSTNIGKKVKWNPNSGVIHSSYHVGSASWERNIFPWR